MPSKLSEKHPRGFGYIVWPILPNFNWSWAGPTGRYSENSHSINQKIQKTGFFWRFLSFVEESRQICQTLVLENESSNLHLAYRENRISNASSVLKILPVKGVYILKNPSERDYLQRGVKTGMTWPYTSVLTPARVIKIPVWPNHMVENKDFWQNHL